MATRGKAEGELVLPQRTGVVARLEQAVAFLLELVRVEKEHSGLHSGWEWMSRIHGFGVRPAESREWRGKSSWSWEEEDDDEEMEKREEARERDALESELSRRSGTTERSDAQPLFRWRRRSLRDLAADELDALDGVVGTGKGDRGGDDDGPFSCSMPFMPHPCCYCPAPWCPPYCPRSAIAPSFPPCFAASAAGRVEWSELRWRGDRGHGCIYRRKKR
ncbi:hypothetical protein D1007_52952 [Hordeum vulgare]|nr:hypothetical protein D1007_52952 [Hordeum vulgare]